MNFSKSRESRKVWKYLLLILSGLFLLSVLLVILVLAGVFGKLPAVSELKGIQNPVATEIYSSDGILMGKYYIQNREYLDPQEITPVIRHALTATEDVRFYKHGGIDLRSLGRVVVKSLLLGDRQSGGGSTLTQQLAKNLYPRKDYGMIGVPVNKIREMIIARRMEKVYTKDEILELYLSTISFGEDTYGIKSASTRFFNRDPGELKTEETALLIGLLKATDYYNPVKNSDRALSRRNVVLDQMVKYGFLDGAEGDSLKKLPLDLAYSPLPHYAGIAPYFRELIRDDLEVWCRTQIKADGKPYDLYRDGLRIVTTIDSRLQRFAEEAMREHMTFLQKLFDDHWRGRNLWNGMADEQLFINHDRPFSKEKALDSARIMNVFTWEGMQERDFNTLDSLKHYLHFLQAGFCAMDVHTGAVRAWIGGIDHKYFKYDHVTSKRQVGSTFKPIVYMAALENGKSPCDYYPNDSVVYEAFDDWVPRNADRTYGGFYSLQGALVHSVNTISVQLLMETGIDSVIDLARRAGIESGMPAVPSLALGTANISLLEMTNFYQAIANHGIFEKPEVLERITDKNGNTLYEKPPARDGVPVFSPRNAELMTGMLRKAVDQGTGAALRVRYGIRADIAGKTGTTQNYTDGWFIGFTPELVAGVWIGGDLQNVRFRDMAYGQGAFSAMPLWAGFMNRVFNDPRGDYLPGSAFSLSDSAIHLLDCEDYMEHRPFRFRDFEKFRYRSPLRWFFRRVRRR
ncbi:MAG: transglycosylase domain-containing protein [Bacteroidales bacterium]|nr:transglycosylase domain-containing protein [Bacteroidales bacterium]MBN2699646.1 transglycosylase domain-containing protein [Bacteroidales bacterium]